MTEELGFIPVESLDEALKILNIEDYKERILNSNSHGELFHCTDYLILASLLRKLNTGEGFRDWFEYVVDFANKNWQRPESIYQYILKVFKDHRDEAYKYFKENEDKFKKEDKQ